MAAKKKPVAQSPRSKAQGKASPKPAKRGRISKVEKCLQYLDNVPFTDNLAETLLTEVAMRNRSDEDITQGGKLTKGAGMAHKRGYAKEGETEDDFFRGLRFVCSPASYRVVKACNWSQRLLAATAETCNLMPKMHDHGDKNLPSAFLTLMCDPTHETNRQLWLRFTHGLMHRVKSLKEHGVDNCDRKILGEPGTVVHKLMSGLLEEIVELIKGDDPGSQLWTIGRLEVARREMVKLAGGNQDGD